jgi:hypothetical protein
MTHVTLGTARNPSSLNFAVTASCTSNTVRSKRWIFPIGGIETSPLPGTESFAEVSTVSLLPL